MNQHHGLSEVEPLREGGREGEREDKVSGLRGVLIVYTFGH